MTHLLFILLIVLEKRKESDKFLFCFYVSGWESPTPLEKT